MFSVCSRTNTNTKMLFQSQCIEGNFSMYYIKPINMCIRVTLFLGSSIIRKRLSFEKKGECTSNPCFILISIRFHRLFWSPAYRHHPGLDDLLLRPFLFYAPWHFCVLIPSVTLVRTETMISLKNISHELLKPMSVKWKKHFSIFCFESKNLKMKKKCENNYKINNQKSLNL